MKLKMPELREMLSKLVDKPKPTRKKVELVDQILAAGTPSTSESLDASDIPPKVDEAASSTKTEASVTPTENVAKVKAEPVKTENVAKVKAEPVEDERVEDEPPFDPLAPPKAMAPDLDTCPGYDTGCRFGADIYMTSYVACMVLHDEKGQRLKWEDGRDFWEITRQAWSWDNQMRKAKGDSWCVNLWAASKIIQEVGCAKVQIRCGATDVSWVNEDYEWGWDDFGSVPFLGVRGQDLPPVRDCLKEKCLSK